MEIRRDLIFARLIYESTGSDSQNADFNKMFDDKEKGEIDNVC